VNTVAKALSIFATPWQP